MSFELILVKSTTCIFLRALSYVDFVTRNSSNGLNIKIILEINCFRRGFGVLGFEV